ncbi:MAG: 3'-5' exoribonuclease [Psychromonas sp.]|jgi:3'-5' exoribonuclease|uniref:HD domain-containing protein n=1 Tax=Psychromonas sp. TaxID=1884585 RepID=UPI0039E2EEC7
MNNSYQANHSKSVQVQPELNMAQLLQLNYIQGIYRLAGFLLLFDKNQRPYWKLLVSDVNGTVAMFMFEQPNCANELAHGTFIEVEAEIKHYGKSVYVNITKLMPINSCYINKSFALNSLPSYNTPKPQDLVRLKNVIGRIENSSLVNFLADVLVPIEVCIPFTQAPASLNYHHNKPGGLLEHSVEVAEIVSELPLKTQIETDLAITGAVLHDIGKIKSLDGGMRRMETGKWVDHGSLTLEVCSDGLAILDKCNSLFANILRHIWTCRSPGARYGYESKLAIADAVQLADRFSARNAVNPL